MSRNTGGEHFERTGRAPQGAPTRISRDAKAPSVLLVDDDPDVAPLVDLALAPFQVRMDTVTTGSDALARLRAEAYDLVILDLAMAELHGFDVLRTLKARPRSSRMPVLILTADDSLEALARSFGYGADDVVTKPFKTQILGIRAFRLIRPFA